MFREQCEKEIVDLHRFFETWFKASVEKDKKVFERLSSTLHDKFTLVFPNGQHLGRQAVIDRVFEAHGLESSNPRYFRIWIDKVQCHFEADDRCLMTSEEWHEDNGSISARISSAWFLQKEGLPNNAQWLHLHETWIPGKETHVKGL